MKMAPCFIVTEFNTFFVYVLNKMAGRGEKHYLPLPDDILGQTAQSALARPVAFQFKSDLFEHFPAPHKLGSAIWGTKYHGHGGTHTPSFITKTHDINGHDLGMTRERHQRTYHEHAKVVFDPFTMAKHGHRMPPPNGLLSHPHTVR